MGAEGLIEVLCGEVGSGKTLFAVGMRIIPHLARGGVVCTNIDLRLYPWSSVGYHKSYPGLIKVLHDRFAWDLQPGQVVYLGTSCYRDLHTLIPEGRPDLPVLVVVDEALEGYDSLDRDDNKKKGEGGLRDTLSFFRHCRKLRIELCLILQTFADLNNRIRTKCTRVISLRDTNKMRVPIIRCPWPIRNMILCQQWSPSDKIGLLWQRYMGKYPWIYACYDTADMSLSDVRCGLGMSEDFRGKGKVQKVLMTTFQKSMLWAAVFCCCVLGGFLVNARKELVRISADLKRIEAAASGLPAVVSAGPEALPAGPETIRVRFNGSSLVGGVRRVYAAGRDFVEGKRYEGMICMYADEDQVLLQRPDGFITTLLPLPPEPPEPPERSSARGDPRRAPPPAAFSPASI